MRRFLGLMVFLAGCGGSTFDSGSLTIDLSGSLPWTATGAQATTVTEPATADFDLRCAIDAKPDGSGSWSLSADVPADVLDGVRALALDFSVPGYYLADGDTFALDFVPDNGELGLAVTGETDSYEHTPDSASSGACVGDIVGSDGRVGTAACTGVRLTNATGTTTSMSMTLQWTCDP